MGDELALRRHLYEQLARSRRRGGKRLRRQIAVLTGWSPGEGPDDGSAGVREPRRPFPSAGPARQALEPEAGDRG